MFKDVERLSAAWKKSSKCSMGTCVEVLVQPDEVLIRDSKELATGSDLTILSLTHPQWSLFLLEVCRLKPDGSNGAIIAKHRDDGWVEVRSQRPGDNQVLTFDAEEWRAFERGVRLSEFGDIPPHVAGVQTAG